MKILNKIISLVIIACLCCAPVTAIAETLPPLAKGKIVGLKAGDKAPYSGVLLDEIAAAKLLTDKKYSDEQWKLKLDYELAKESLRSNLIIESQKISYKALQEKHYSLINIKNEEIRRLSKIASTTNDYSVWWASGGIIVGIGLTIAVVHAVHAGPK